MALCHAMPNSLSAALLRKLASDGLNIFTAFSLANQEKAIQRLCYIKTHLHTNTHCLHCKSIETVPEIASVLVLYIFNDLSCIPIQNPLFSPVIILLS